MKNLLNFNKEKHRVSHLGRNYPMHPKGLEANRLENRLAGEDWGSW